MWDRSAVALLAFFALSFLFHSPAPATDSDRPNVIVFLVDDMGWTDANTYGSDLYQTPNIDRLGRTGVKFTDAYSACTVCSPTRGALMTGMNPGRTNLTDWIHGAWEDFSKNEREQYKLMPPDWTQRLEKKYTTIAETLDAEGYKTAHLGKWHLTPSLQSDGISRQDVRKYFPKQHGFDVNVAGNQWGKPGSYYWPYRRGGGGPMQTRVANFPPMEKHQGEYLTYMLTDEAVGLLQQWQDEPFFMYMSHYAVHTPIQGPGELKVEYQRHIQEKGGKQELTHDNAEYAAMIEAMDTSLGRIMGKLRELGIAGETVIMFTSDNGGHPVTENDPLRAYKGSAYEGGVRVPMIIRWPGQTPKGGVSDEPVITHDLYPTILEMTGTPGDPAHNEKVDGRSLTSILRDPDASLDRDALYWHYPHYHRANPYSAVRAGKWRLIHFYLDDRVELYNLEEDIGETNDLSDKRPEKTKQLNAKLDAWREKVDAQPPRENPLYGVKEASYRFADGKVTNDEEGSYPLKTVSNGEADIGITDENTLFLPGHDAPGERIFLEGDGPGPSTKWMVSFWFRTPTVDQGKAQGLFSNNRGPDQNWSWQIDVHNGTLRLQSKDEGDPNPVISADDRNLKPNTWYHVVARKAGSNGDGELYLGTKKGIEKLGAVNANPGGLQMFRLGVDRATNRLYRAELSKVTVYRASSISLDKLNNAGPFGNDPKN